MWIHYHVAFLFIHGLNGHRNIIQIETSKYGIALAGAIRFRFEFLAACNTIQTRDTSLVFSSVIYKLGTVFPVNGQFVFTSLSQTLQTVLVVVNYGIKCFKASAHSISPSSSHAMRHILFEILEQKMKREYTLPKI